MESANGTVVSDDELQYKLFDFYYDVLSVVYDFEDKCFRNLVASVKFTNYARRFKGDDATRTKMDFDENFVRCAYSLKYAVLSTLSVVDHFMNIQKYDRSFVENTVSKGKIKITCLGAGSATEVVAISKAISDIFDKKKLIGKLASPLKLCFTIIDICDGWKEWSEAVVKSLRNHSLCNSSNVDIRLRFVHADLTVPMNLDILKVIEKSQIITLVKFVSTISDDFDKPKKGISQLFSDIALKLKPKAWIFFLDYAGGGHCRTVESIMNKYRYFETREMCLHKEHALEWSPNSNSDPLSHNRFIRNRMQYNTRTKVSSCAWSFGELKIVNIKKFKPKVKKETKVKELKVKESCIKISGIPIRVKSKGSRHANDFLDCDFFED